jgi:hypothetical protein
MWKFQPPSWKDSPTRYATPRKIHKVELRDRVEKALRLALKAGYNAGRQRELAELMKGARGIVDSGVPDLASNPRHLAGFRRARSPH